MSGREKILLLIIGILSTSLLAGFTTNFGGVYSDSKVNQEPQMTQTQLVQISKEPTAEEKIQPALLAVGAQTKSPLTVIFKEVENSVVQITSKVSTINPYIIINGMPLESQSTRLGSGFVYDQEGHIITNHHVVAGAKEVDVRFVDGNIYSAKVIGSDPFNDIAVLQIIDDFSEEHVVPLKIGDSSELEVGQQIIAIGNPFGLSNTMTTGIVSQIGRLLPNTESGFSIPNVIQTDAAINPGNSGGPMLNLQGQVIGINTAIQSKTGEFSGIGFAVPSNTIKRIVPSLIEKGSYEHPWLGVAGTSLTPDITKQLGLPKNFKGVLVTTVVDGGPAQKAGLQEATYTAKGGLKGGDIIIALDGRQIRDMDDLIVYIADNKSVGDSILMQINRNGEMVELTATLQARPTN
ncbi:MAG: trypsin-like peptidase domain-containing protein [Candidatus Nitrosotenuis sp.]